VTFPQWGAHALCSARVKLKFKSPTVTYFAVPPFSSLRDHAVMKSFTLAFNKKPVITH